MMEASRMLGGVRLHVDLESYKYAETPFWVEMIGESGDSITLTEAGGRVGRREFADGEVLDVSDVVPVSADGDGSYRCFDDVTSAQYLAMLRVYNAAEDLACTDDFREQIAGMTAEQVLDLVEI